MGGASKVVIAANKGIKMDLARQIGAADVYIDLDRQNAKAQWEQIKKDYPCEIIVCHHLSPIGLELYEDLAD